MSGAHVLLSVWKRKVNSRVRIGSPEDVLRHVVEICGDAEDFAHVELLYHSQLICRKNKRHTNFKQTVTETGREPNTLRIRLIPLIICKKTV